VEIKKYKKYWGRAPRFLGEWMGLTLKNLSSTLNWLLFCIEKKTWSHYPPTLSDIIEDFGNLICSVLSLDV